MKIFFNNDDYIFGELIIQILEYYSEKGTELYSKGAEFDFKGNELDSKYEKKYAKYYLEEALNINKNYSIQKRVKSYSELKFKYELILNNCKELINIIKAESIAKHCKSFSKTDLIDEREFENEEEILDILDKFKEAFRYLEKPKKKEDKILKSIYLANIIKIEYKIFKSNDYDKLLKMIEECINLKAEAPKGCNSPFLNWFKEICEYKDEIGKKLKNKKENPKDDEKRLDKLLSQTINKIDVEFEKGNIEFFYYILTNHKPTGLEDEFIFLKIKDLKKKFNSNKMKFLNKLSRFYNPQRYKGDKFAERKIHYIMREISKKLNLLYEDI